VSLFCKGDITNFNDVYNFGRDWMWCTIEIENVNEDALQQLIENKIFPNVAAKNY
jgi:hypothetical protein